MGPIATRLLGERLGIPAAEQLPLDRLMGEIEDRDVVAHAALIEYLHASDAHLRLVQSETHESNSVVTLSIVRALLRKRAAWAELRVHLGR